MGHGDREPVLIICGPTCSGKSSVAMRLAQTLGMEIISADSVQVYRRLDIGSAKPTQADRLAVVHHLVDIVDPDEDYDAGRYAQDALEALQKVRSRPVLCGGTGLYLQALVHGLAMAPPRDAATREALKERAAMAGTTPLYEELLAVDPEYAERIHANDAVRVIRALEVYQVSGKPLSAWHREQGPAAPRFPVRVVGLNPRRESLYRAIDARVDAMLNAGWLREVEEILRDGYAPDLKSLGTLGYRHLVAYLREGLDLNETVRQIKRDHRHYAKRQLTWFRKQPGVTWFTDPDRAFDTLVTEGGRHS